MLPLGITIVVITGPGLGPLSLDVRYMITNLRDVGEAVNMICEKQVMNEGVFFRSGSINQVTDLPKVSSILNLRKGPDNDFGIKQIHCPADDRVENYDTSRGAVRKWLRNAFDKVMNEEKAWPLLVHCTAGKDRTGVFVAAALLSIGLPKDVVMDEYLLSEGVVDRRLMHRAITGFGDVGDYLRLGGNAENRLVKVLKCT